MAKANPVNNVFYLSTFPPRECGIATFTQDLVLAFDKKFNPKIKSLVGALSDHPASIYKYDKGVAYQIDASELENYVALAKDLNAKKNIKIINVQHEFGLFGGDWGNYLIPFLQVVEKPVVTTFHSVISLKDTRNQATHSQLKKVVTTIAKRSNAVVVMNKLSQNILEAEYDVPRSKIYFIPHGIPQTPFEPSEQYKISCGLQGKTVLSTFGLLSPNKGIEYTIRSLPLVIKKFPDVIYLVLGVTHPAVRTWNGEAYRIFLMNEVDKLGLKNHVKFYDKYLALEELLNYLKATDIYVAPSIDPEQSVSGTVSYALGCGRPVIATGSSYTKHIINQENGIEVRPKSASDITNALLSLLNDPKRIKSMSAGAYELSRSMIWSNVAAEYFKLFQKFAPDIGTEHAKMPEIKIHHIARLSDTFGILQFAKYSTPRTRYGYTVDDNARALLACTQHYEKSADPQVLSLIHTYLAFLKYAQRANGTFASTISYQRKRDGRKDEDVQGRAIWALGYIASRYSLSQEVREEAKRMLKKALRFLPKIESPRSIAFTLLGLYHYVNAYPNKHTKQLFEKLADFQLSLYRNCASDKWQWFEDHLTYSNSKLPESLLYAYAMTKKKKYLSAALASLNFLTTITFQGGVYWPIGESGWYYQNKNRAFFDQQPEDVASMVETKIFAYQITKDKRYLQDALNAFQWFLGRNHLGQMVYDEVTGGCNDGIHQNRINLNQGAESTVSYLLARLAIEEVLTRPYGHH